MDKIKDYMSKHYTGEDRSREKLSLSKLDRNKMAEKLSCNTNN